MLISDNIGTPQGQQAILAAANQLGLNTNQIAAAVSQATGQTITPQQVSAVAAQAPAQAPKQVMAATPSGLVASGYTAPAAITPQVQQQSLGNDTPMGTSTAQSSTPANLLSQYDQSMLPPPQPQSSFTLARLSATYMLHLSRC